MSVATPPIARQIKLPLSRAIEIAWKSIRLRLSRSLLVTSGIVLSLAFLTSIQTGDAVVDGMRRWVADAAASPRTADLRAARTRLDARLADGRVIRDEARATPAVKDAPAVNESAAFGATLDELSDRLKILPASNDELRRWLAARPEAAARLRAWIDAALELQSLQAELNGPQTLASLMEGQGVPVKPDEIHAARIQNRWMLGLALLVAFVGILNAMLMSVTERFREIGTMKCLGALDGFIVKLFLIESLFQGVVGTILGVALGLAISLAMAAATYGRFAFVNVPYTQLGWSVLLSTLIGITLTVLGAVYPAWQASRMQPIEAMRSET